MKNSDIYSLLFLLSSSVHAMLISFAVNSSLILPHDVCFGPQPKLQPDGYGNSPAMTSRII